MSNTRGGGTSSCLQGCTGTLGLGTTSPAGPLHWLGRGGGRATADNVFRVETTGGTVGPSFRFKSMEGADYLMTATGSGNGGGAGAFRIFDMTGNATRLFIAPGGNTGVGMSNPQSLLDVAGTINASQYNLGGNRVL